MLHIASKHVNMDLLNVTSQRTCGRKAGRPNFPDLDVVGDRPWSSARDACNAAACASGAGTKVAAAPARVPDRRGRPDIHTRLSTKQQVMSEETPIVELLGATHVKVYASGRVDGAVGEDGVDGEQCVVINCIPHSSCCSRRRSPSCAPGRHDLRSRARPPGTRPGEALLGHGGAPIACPPRTVAAINGHAHAGGLITALGCDNRIAQESALEFSLNEVPIGISHQACGGSAPRRLN
jgi:hypothetical protein